MFSNGNSFGSKKALDDESPDTEAAYLGRWLAAIQPGAVS